MAIKFALLVPIAVASMILICSTAFGISDYPFVVAQKKVSLTRLKSGADQIAVSIDIYNKGTAYGLRRVFRFYGFNSRSVIRALLCRIWVFVFEC